MDFPAILAAAKGRQPSVVLLRSDSLSPETLAKIVVPALENSENDLISGAIISIDAARVRLRILPPERR